MLIAASEALINAWPRLDLITRRLIVNDRGQLFFARFEFRTRSVEVFYGDDCLWLF